MTAAGSYIQDRDSPLPNLELARDRVDRDTSRRDSLLGALRREVFEAGDRVAGTGRVYRRR
jgi:hypothetical protein